MILIAHRSRASWTNLLSIRARSSTSKTLGSTSRTRSQIRSSPTLASKVSMAAGILQSGDQQSALKYALKYATIPPEVQARQELLAELKEWVLGMASSATSLVGFSRGATTATTSAHKMGGVGKTSIAVQLIRHLGRSGFAGHSRAVGRHVRKQL